MPTKKLDGIVEADETYVGGVKRDMERRYIGNKTAVVERGGRVRSEVVRKISGDVIGRKQNVAKTAHLNTDEAPVYKKPAKSFASHDVMNRSQEEYVRHDACRRLATNNTAESFFGNSKSSLDGTHHQVRAKHLTLYLAERDYKYNTRDQTDGARTAIVIPKIVGKRLMLRRPKSSMS